MILDSSAIVAIALAEPGYERFLAAIAGAGPVGVGAPTVVEATAVLSQRIRGDARPMVEAFLRECRATVIPFSEEHSYVAVDAFLRYGKGRHPARLNFGDCLSYATAVVAGRPLLFKGEDFPQTDVKAAI